MDAEVHFSGHIEPCPDIGGNEDNDSCCCKQNATPERLNIRVIPEKPQFHLAKLHFHEFKSPSVNCPNANTFECAYSAMPDYAQGYTGHIPTNLWTFCENNDKTCGSSSCPVQAYPLSCSEQGSPCLENYCKTSCHATKGSGDTKGSEENPLRYGDYGTEGYLCSQTCGDKTGKTKRSADKKNSYSCCFSSSKRAPCEGPEKGKSSTRYRFQGEMEINPFRRGGVVPNYMGHIPGLQVAFGECFGISAGRLLNRHFREMESRED